MKKITLLLVVLGLTVALKAQTYPIAKEGTTWQYVYTSLGGYSCYSWIVAGDTTVNEKTYKKIYSYSTTRYILGKAKLEYAFREEGDKIYALADGMNDYLQVENGEVLLYDFSLQVGDTFPKTQNKPYNVVEKVDYVEIDGMQRKHFSFSYYDEWIEGIGSLYRSFGYPVSETPTNGSVNTLEMFEQDGRIVHGSRRFNLLAKGVHWTERTSTRDNVDESGNELFELQHFSMSGDTIINGISYRKVYVNGYPYMNLREDESGNIYYNRGVEKDGLLYDFGPKTFYKDGMHYTDDTGKDCLILKSQEFVPNTMTLLNHRYVYFLMNDSSYHHQKRARSERVYLIHGIGLTQGIFQHLFTLDLDCICYNDLVSLYDENNNLIYQNLTFKENGELALGITSTHAQERLSIINHGKEIEFVLKDTSMDKAHVGLYNMDGSLLSIILMENGRAVTNNMPSGIYLYRLESGNRILENGKFIVN